MQRNWGNGDGAFYPLNRPDNDGKTYIGYPCSLRLELPRWNRDYEYLPLEQLVNSRKGVKNKVLEEARQLLDIPEQIYTNEQTYSKNPRDILEYRQKVAESILKLK